MTRPLRSTCRPRPTALFNAGWNAGFEAGFNAACDAMFDDIFNEAYNAAIEMACRDIEEGEFREAAPAPTGSETLDPLGNVRESEAAI